jgi:hypothetical protein
VRVDVVVLGAGAAGLMCALTAGRRGRRVLVLDHAGEVGKKILISGGGRCNFTNLEAGRPERFLSGNPHFARSALTRYTAADFIALVERHRIAYHEKTLGQLFCDGSAREIVAMLLAECASAGVEIRVGHRVAEIAGADGFRIETSGGRFDAAALVVATGGPSIPKMGATGFAYDVARRFGLFVTGTRPALVPLRLDGAVGALCRDLAGVSVDAVARFGRQSFRENALFTHRGLSGPAILQISSYWRAGEEIGLDLAPGRDAGAFLKERKRARPKAEPATVLAELLPARLAQAAAEGALAPAPAALAETGEDPHSAAPDRHALRGPLAALPDRALEALGQRINDWRIRPSGTEGFAKAEVTAGGVDTAGLSQQTMEARAVPGLYFIGEAVDVTGWLGGYNFQWAWSSGWAAGQAC